MFLTVYYMTLGFQEVCSSILNFNNLNRKDAACDCLSLTGVYNSGELKGSLKIDGTSLKLHKKCIATVCGNSAFLFP